MNNPIQSQVWYRVAGIKPQLRQHVRLHRHRYRGEVWYVLQDPVSNRIHRFTPAARLMLAAMNGERSVDELWQLVNQQLGEAAPTQDEVVNLLGQLHAADLLQSDVPIDVSELFQRARREQQTQQRKHYANPMSIRFSLWDPERFLNRMNPLLQRLWNGWGIGLWLLLVLPALFLLPLFWQELTHNLSDRVLALDNVLLLALLFPIIKALHELGHAAAVKAGGGEVHDMGVMLLVLMPVPYVDATAASAFKSKYERTVVSAAGMGVELLLAALAFYLWMLVEPGLLRAVLFNVMLIAGVSALLFNGNPLLRYDAYYMLTDLIEIPNLAGQSLRYWTYLLNRYVFDVSNAEPPLVKRGEKIWFLCYGPASMFYRIWVALVIALFIATQFFVIGVVLALWALVSMLCLPLWKGIRYLLDSPQLALRRRRAIALSATTLVGLLVFLVFIPMPFRSTAEGVVWFADEAMVRTQAEGFVERLNVAPGGVVKKGDLLLTVRDPSLQTQLTVAEAKVAELEANYGSELVKDLVQAKMVWEQLQVEQANLAHLQQRVANLSVYAQSDGHLVVPAAQNLPGRFYRKGELLAYVVKPGKTRVRVALEQPLIDVVRQATEHVWLRQAHRPDMIWAGQIVREVPAAQNELPSPVLSTAGGGHIALDPSDSQAVKTLDRVFQLEISLPERDVPVYFGERVYVRFDHQHEPLAKQWYRGVRTLFLSHLKV